MAKVTEPHGPSPRRVPHGWLGSLAVLFLLFLLAGVAGWATTAWLRTEADRASGDQLVSARLAADRSGLLVAGLVIGAGGALLLFSPHWRGWWSGGPGTPAPRPGQFAAGSSAPAGDGWESYGPEQALLLPELLAGQARADATERRVTELYLRAAEQLGSDKAPLRMAGLYALERLAAEYQDHRQSIVDVICAYLRIPWTAPAVPAGQAETGPAQAGPARGDTGQERQVRITAQRILARHLRATVIGAGGMVEHSPRYWGDVTVDLAGAILIDLDFARCELGRADFTGATFLGRTSFQQTRFRLAAWFGGSTFSGGAQFHSATFDRGAWFRECAFHGTAGFGRSTFGGAGDAVFERVEFRGYADFGSAVLDGNATFLHTRFQRGATFRDATFQGSAHFAGASVDGTGQLEQASFQGARFCSAARFAGTAFRTGLSFAGAHFLDGADFADAVMSGRTTFAGVTALPGAGALGLSGTRVPARLAGQVWPPGWVVEGGAADGIGALRYLGGGAGPAGGPGAAVGPEPVPGRDRAGDTAELAGASATDGASADAGDTMDVDGATAEGAGSSEEDAGIAGAAGAVGAAGVSGAAGAAGAVGAVGVSGAAGAAGAAGVSGAAGDSATGATAEPAVDGSGAVAAGFEVGGGAVDAEPGLGSAPADDAGAAGGATTVAGATEPVDRVGSPQRDPATEPAVGQPVVVPVIPAPPAGRAGGLPAQARGVARCAPQPRYPAPSRAAAEPGGRAASPAALTDPLRGPAASA